MIIYTTANINPCIPISNLSTVHKHYETYTNLCSTIKDTLETRCNLSAATNLQHYSMKNKALGVNACGTLDNLSSNIIHPFRPYYDILYRSTALQDI